MGKFDELMLDEETEKKAIRLARSIEKKFEELRELGVSAVMVIGGCTPTFRYFPTEIVNNAGDLNSDMNGFENVEDVEEYELYQSCHNNIQV